VGDHNRAVVDPPPPRRPSSPPASALQACPSAFAHTPVAIAVDADGYRTVLHRGVPIGRFDPALSAHTERRTAERTLAFDVLEDAVSVIVGLERDRAARSGGQIKEQDILRDLVRDALNALDFSEVLDLHRLVSESRDDRPSPVGRLRTITGGSLRSELLIKALAAKTIERIGVDVLREAFQTRRDRRRRDTDTDTDTQHRRAHARARSRPTGP
jgi:hypothetical protein